MIFQKGGMFFRKIYTPDVKGGCSPLIQERGSWPHTPPTHTQPAISLSFKLHTLKINDKCIFKK